MFMSFLRKVMSFPPYKYRHYRKLTMLTSFFNDTKLGKGAQNKLGEGETY